MFGLGKLFGRKNRNRAQEDGTVNPAARTQEGAPAAAPRPQMGQMQSNYLGVVQSLRAKQSSAGGESATPNGQRNMAGAHRVGSSQRTAQSVGSSVDEAIAMAQAAVAESPVANKPLSAPQAEAQQMQADYRNVIHTLRASGSGFDKADAAIADTNEAIHDAQMAMGTAKVKPLMADGVMDTKDTMDDTVAALQSVAPAPVPQAEAAQTIEAAAEVMKVAGPQPMSAKVAGLICLPDLYAKSGLTGEEELPPQAQAMIAALSNYHEFMDTRVIAMKHTRKNDEHLPEVQALDAVIRAGNAMVAGFKGKNKKSSTYTALMPGVSQLLIQAYQLMPMIAGMDKILVPYVFATHNDQVSVAELVESPQAKALMGAMSSIAVQDGVPRDGGAEVMRLYGASADKRKNAKKKDRIGEVASNTDLGALGAVKSGSAVEEANARIFPSIDSASFIEDSARLLQMLDDLSTKTNKDSLETHHANLFVMRLLSQALASPGIQAMCSTDTKIASEAQRDASEADAAIVEKLRQAAGKTVGSLSTAFTDFLLSKGQITQVSEDAIVTGGNLSATFIDKANEGVFRSSKKGANETAAQALEKQKKAFNGSYDEAMSKLDEALGLGIIAKAEVAAYKNKAGEAQIGSKMELVKGNSMESALAKDKKAGTSLVDRKSPRLLADYQRLAVIDYIAMHTDRNRGNYMYNPDAGPDEPMIKGIDNDMIFNMSAVEEHGQGATKTANDKNNVNFMLIERNAGQAGMIQTRSRDDGGPKKIQGHYQQALLSLSAFEVISPEIQKIVMNIDSDKVNAALRPYVNVTARLAALERIQELQTYVSNTSKVVSMYKEDGSVDEENMKEYYSALDRNAKTGLMTGIDLDMDLTTKKLKFTLTLSNLVQWAGSAANAVWGEKINDDLLAEIKKGKKQEVVKKYLEEQGITLDVLSEYLVPNLESNKRMEIAKKINAENDDPETQIEKIKAYVKSQSMDDFIWDQFG